MSESHTKNLRNIVNASGFLFQLRIEHEIMENSNRHGWKVLSREHPWEDSELRKEGYIDLVLESKHNVFLRMVIECKRARNASWVFLIQNDSSDKVEEARCLLTNLPHQEDRKEDVFWHNLDLEPSSPEAGFCAVRGTGEKAPSMLEMLARDLLRSLDCLACEELELARQSDKTQQWRIYFPVIVTTAQLEVCRFSPNDVTLKEGTLQDGKFETVPFIRFRKSLTTRLTPGAMPESLTEANKHKERTIFVINASELSNVIAKWSVGGEVKNLGAPWLR